MENPFIKDICGHLGIAKPDIEVPLREQYGQLAEDVIVDGLLTAWAVRTGTNLSDCRYLEIGANHPFATSSSILLHRLHGMSGVLVEANESLLEALRSTRTQDEIVYCAVTTDDVEEINFFVSNQSELSSLSRRFVEEWRGGTVGLAEVRKVPAQRINALLNTHFSKVAPVFMSVDVEGLDLDILQDVDWTRWRPVVVQAEPSDHFSPGQSKKIIRYMHEQRYVLVARTDVNLIFTDRTAMLGALPLAPHEEGRPEIPVPTAPFIAPSPNYSKTASVGIVTRTKNRAVLLRRALESVKNQTYPHWQLVVVNDGGEPEPVEELVEAILGGDERVSVVHHPAPVGMEVASNSGLSRLATELAVIHDDDDSWAPDMLAVATSVLSKKNAEIPSIRGIVTRVNVVQETVTANHIEIHRVEPFEDRGPDRLAEGLIKLPRLAMKNLFPPIAFVFDLSLARQLGGFDQNLHVLGDWDFHLRFCTEADIWVHPELLAFYHHRRNATGDMGNSVIASKSKHELYNTYLHNKLLRTASDPVAAAMVLLREQGLLLEEMHGKLNDIRRIFIDT